MLASPKASEKQQMSFNFLSKYKLVISIICTLAIIALVYFICSSYKNKPVLNNTEEKEEFIAPVKAQVRKEAIKLLAQDILNLCTIANKIDVSGSTRLSDSVIRDNEIKKYYEAIKHNLVIAAPFDHLISSAAQNQIADFTLTDGTFTGSIRAIGKITVKTKDEMCLILDNIKGEFYITQDGGMKYISGFPR